MSAGGAGFIGFRAARNKGRNEQGTIPGLFRQEEGTVLRLFSACSVQKNILSGTDRRGVLAQVYSQEHVPCFIELFSAVYTQAA